MGPNLDCYGPAVPISECEVGSRVTGASNNIYLYNGTHIHSLTPPKHGLEFTGFLILDLVSVERLAWG